MGDIYLTLPSRRWQDVGMRAELFAGWRFYAKILVFLLLSVAAQLIILPFSMLHDSQAENLRWQQINAARFPDGIPVEGVNGEDIDQTSSTTSTDGDGVTSVHTTVDKSAR
jgi:hypothetical protein